VPRNSRISAATGKSGLQHLSQEALILAVEEPGSRDPDLLAIVERFGPPPLLTRPPGIPTLLRIILEQQASLASGPSRV
jgi:DNA-3-methyladenine glycosylase II